MEAFAALFKSKTFISGLLSLIYEALNAKFGFGTPSGASLLVPASMSLRTWGKETKKEG